DALHDEGFAAFVGPLEGTRDALLILRASGADEIEERLAADPWSASGLLNTTQISPWQLRLGSLGPVRRPPAKQADRDAGSSGLGGVNHRRGAERYDHIGEMLDEDVGVTSPGVPCRGRGRRPDL